MMKPSATGSASITGPERTGSSWPAKVLTATLLLGALAGCQADGESGNEPTPEAGPTTGTEAVCSQDQAGVTLSEEGWSITRTKDTERWVSYAAVFDVDPELTGVEVRVEWFDAQGRHLGWGDAAEEESTYESLPLLLSGDTGAVSDFVWVVGEPATITYTVTQTCRLPEGTAPKPTVEVTNPTLVAGPDHESELAMDVTSGFDQPVDVDLTIVFRDEADQIIGGTLHSDGYVSLNAVAPGTAPYVLTIHWEDFYPEEADIAVTEVYAMPL